MGKRSHCSAALILVFGGLSSAQQAGTAKDEYHLPLTLSECTADSGCTEQTTSVTLDSNWRWTHDSKYQNCCDGTSWDASVCNTPTDCAAECEVDGVPAADWTSTYGVTGNGTSLTLGYETSAAVGSRMYVLENETHYKMFKLLNREFSFDVDVSGLPCGINGALYFSEMMADGGSSEFDGNDAGAKFGTGYCDAQCPQDIKFINGEANVLDWTDSTPYGKYGSCCAEMDIWEANSQAAAFTPHPCSLDGPARCENDDDCGQSGFCDKAGCDLNTYRFGNTTFFGNSSSFSVDTTRTFTVVTQFITNDSTDSGDLVEIRRKYIQDEKVIESPELVIGGSAYSSVTTDFCAAQKAATNDTNEFEKRGGLTQMGASLRRGMVLVMSIWDDATAQMLWLDGTYPIASSGMGAQRGPCAASSGDPDTTRKEYPDSYVKFANIKFGAIGSTSSSSALRKVANDDILV